MPLAELRQIFHFRISCNYFQGIIYYILVAHFLTIEDYDPDVFSFLAYQYTIDLHR